MHLRIEPKEINDAYSTPIVQQTCFWSRVKERMGMNSSAFEFSIRNSDIYSQVGGFSYTNADLILFFQYLNQEDYIAYLPYGPEIEPSEENLRKANSNILPSNTIVLDLSKNEKTPSTIYKNGSACLSHALPFLYNVYRWKLFHILQFPTQGTGAEHSSI